MLGNLLIIDDEVVLLRMLKLNLKSLADNIFTAENGFVGLEILSKEKIHCVICDINMPGMNGIEVIKKTRENHNEVPFIFYTGHGNISLMLEAAKYGAFEFLNKPDLDGLEEVVIRGLKKGAHEQAVDLNVEESFSEFQKLLKDLD